MPEFQLKSEPDWDEHLDAFTFAYIEAFFWTNADSGHDGSLANKLGTKRLTKKSLQSIVEDCRAFQAHAREALEQAYDREGYDESQAGHDFWLTRQGHGAGFWDRKQLDEGDLGRVLSKFAKAHGEVYGSIYRGWVYHD